MAATDTLSVPPDVDTVGVVHSREETRAAFELGAQRLADADAHHAAA